MSLQRGFKVVQSNDKFGHQELSVIPHTWEKSGKLFCPKNKSRAQMRKLLEDEGSIPEKGWIQVDCIVKRINLASLEAADEEIDLMESQSDTCASDIETMGKPTAAVVRNAKRKTSSTNKNADSQRHNYKEKNRLDRN